MIANVNMYICLPKFDFNVGDVANPIIVLVVVIIVVFQFELETVRATGMKFCTQVGSDNSTCSYLSKLSDMTIKPFPITNPITATFTTKLHICKQQQHTRS